MCCHIMNIWPKEAKVSVRVAKISRCEMFVNNFLFMENHQRSADSSICLGKTGANTHHEAVIAQRKAITVWVAQLVGHTCGKAEGLFGKQQNQATTRGETDKQALHHGLFCFFVTP